jgi:SAM-dependent methyltransferase
VSESLLSNVRCVRCSAPVDTRALAIACERCGQAYPRVGGIPVLLPRPDAHVELWRRQLGLVLAQAEHTRSGIEEQASHPQALPAAQKRLRALAEGLLQQVNDVAGVLGPALGGPLPATPETGLPRGIVEYIYYLYRDWGWTDTEHDENEKALGAIRQLKSDDFGRLLVVGAGGCRLAYDLHRSCGATETAVLDIDPYLFSIAEAVVRGRAVQLTEASITVQEAERVAKTWTLRAPHGPLDDDSFHFLLANGLAPPFENGTFDTIVTPWFIDRVPPVLEDFLAVLHRLLRPGGRWINQGPLLYAESTPLARRFCREEIFDLAGRAGFRIGGSSAESGPYLVSPLSGRGKLERTLTFEAARVES